MKRIRVLLAKMPALMLDIIHHVVAAQPDMVVIGVVDDRDLPAAVGRARADVVVVGHDAESERDLYMLLLLRRPQLRVLAVAADGKSGCLYDLRPRRVRIGKISARGLAKAIRGPARTVTTAKRRIEVH